MNLLCFIKHDWVVLRRLTARSVVSKYDRDILHEDPDFLGNFGLIFLEKKVCLRCKKIKDEINTFIDAIPYRLKERKKILMRADKRQAETDIKNKERIDKAKAICKESR